ncbi:MULTISPECIES: nucleosidase [unclassified Gordonia (in: high G+C Gram-positive bacteria)]|uniref:nucleosidase n=1 Tax=unclassified Gordonia (in: high G+C Gram-positive bacteria) TaxID=2657482 RepID=UPI0007EAE2B7|nr:MULTISPECIES: nucleosidase [unclassified Gordonia (in: high G+C Gram-positive bacteria)]OBA39297.1 nucleosidase [Gordonia sp. 852002-51296_SCH5728562-b]OBA59019.1 nucleosidase [Gordonia sp. 852002-10350_SCH5691597]
MNSTPTDHDFDPSILIVSATQAEARYVPSGARLLVTGIGKMRATAALTRALADPSAPSTRLVVNIGTAGALHDHHAGLFLPSVVVEHDISATELRAMGYPIVDRWVVPDGDGSVLASGDTFVADPVRRASLARQADLVDMEGCAVTYVAAAFDVRCQLVKVVSDGADEQAMDWPSLVDGAARLLGDWLADGTL